MLRLGSRSQAIGARREKTRRHKIQKWEEDCLSWHKTGTACENSSVAQSKSSQGTLKSRSESAFVIQCTSKEIIQQLNSKIMVQTQYSIWHIMMIFHVINALCLSSQAFVISFTSEFVPRMVFQYMYSVNGTMNGFTEHSLSYFNISNFPAGTAPTTTLFTGVSVCRSDWLS